MRTKRRGGNEPDNRQTELIERNESTRVREGIRASGLEQLAPSVRCPLELLLGDERTKA